MKTAHNKLWKPLALPCALLVAIVTLCSPVLRAQGVEVGDLITVSAKVITVDKKSRMLTLRGEAGGEIELEIGDHVVNFDQIETGDTVNVAYYESITLAKGPEGSAPEIDAEDIVEKAQPGEKPAALLARSVQVSVAVTAIDREARVVTLQLEDGSEVEKYVDPAIAAFDQLKIGDVIQVRITRAIAVSVTRS